MVGIGIVELIVIVFLIFIPCIINIKIAKKKGRHVGLFFFLGLLFPWLSTIVLVILPPKKTIEMPEI